MAPWANELHRVQPLNLTDGHLHSGLTLRQEGGAVNELLDRTTFIHFLRFSAAAIVASAHLRDIMFADYKALPSHPLWFTGVAAFTGFAGDAVMIFFVISGWLVGGGLFENSPFSQPLQRIHGRPRCATLDRSDTSLRNLSDKPFPGVFPILRSLWRRNASR